MILLAVAVVVQALVIAWLVYVHRAERRHLTHLAIARHAGEVRVLDGGNRVDGDHEPPVPIEGLS